MHELKEILKNNKPKTKWGKILQRMFRGEITHEQLVDYCERESYSDLINTQFLPYPSRPSAVEKFEYDKKRLRGLADKGQKVSFVNLNADYANNKEVQDYQKRMTFVDFINKRNLKWLIESYIFFENEGYSDFLHSLEIKIHEFEKKLFGYHKTFFNKITDENNIQMCA
jgi:hypothetical protein